jgi:hypothetical protein
MSQQHPAASLCRRLTNRTPFPSLSPDRSRLTVDVRYEGGSRPRLSLKRVYDRLDPDS